MPSLQRIIRFDFCRLCTAALVSRQIRPPFRSLQKMNPSQNLISNPSGYSSFTAQKSSGTKITYENQSDSSYETDFPSLCDTVGSSSKLRNFKKLGKTTGSVMEQKQEAVHSSVVEWSENVASLQEERSLLNRRVTRIDSEQHQSLITVNSSKMEDIMNVPSVQDSEHDEIVNTVSLPDEHSLPSQYGKKMKGYRSGFVGQSEVLPKVERFNICLPRYRDIESQEVLRPGMVLLKHYLSIREQINIVKACNSLGEGPGGFYRPGYKDGAKLKLHMMCLGKNWDPQTRKYDKRHPVDNCKVPDIPVEFCLLVQRAIEDAHSLIRRDFDMINPEDLLPSMSPDICIVNFYSMHGRLGLHQDRDESRESLRKGLPVVSMSIGDSAEFLYGDGREANQASKVLLESGDVLLFGGDSRMLFHGVPSIVPFSAPEPLKKRTGIRQGRLNLTFRQF